MRQSRRLGLIAGMLLVVCAGRAVPPQAGRAVAAGSPTTTATATPTPSPLPPATAVATPTDTAAPAATPTPSPSPTPFAPGPGTGNPGSCPPGQFGIGTPIGGICIDLFNLFVSAFSVAGVLLAKSAAALLQPVIGITTYAPDFTDTGLWSGLNEFYNDMYALAWVLFGFVFLFRLVDSIGRHIFRNPLAVVFDVLGPVMRVVVYLFLLQYLLHLWFMLIGIVVQDINLSASQDIVRDLTESVTKADPSTLPGVALITVVFSIAFVIIAILIGITRLGGLLILAGLFVVAPLCIICLTGGPFRRIGVWWLENFIAYSFWPLAYAIGIKVDVILLFALPKETGFGSVLIGRLLGIAGLLVLLRMPQLIMHVMGGMDPGEVGATYLGDRVRRALF